MNQISFHELWEAMMEIEPICARFAAERRRDDDIRALLDNIEGMRANKDDIDKIIRFDIEFHELIAKAMCNNAIALSRQVFSSLLLRANALMIPQVPQSIERMIDAHLSIVRSIEESDRQRADELMARHIADFRRGYGLTGLDFDAPIIGSVYSRTLARDR
jgi:DNA-binding FadR family transcriptional regulator